MATVILCSWIFFNLFYIVALYKKDFSIIDTAWALSFFLVYAVGYFTSEQPSSLRVVIVGALVFIWAARLSGYIFKRSLKLKHEDYRYAQWRKQWGDKANIIAYFRNFMLQCLLSLIICYPLYLVHKYNSENNFGTFLDYLGILLWVIGFMFEAVSDYQKDKFKSNDANKGLILQSGLWKYSRHPNYFGEALLWWGIFFVLINQVPVWYAITGPLLLHFMLLKVSGVAMLERKYVDNQDYEHYKKTTNSFIPWFPKAKI